MRCIPGRCARPENGLLQRRFTVGDICGEPSGPGARQCAMVKLHDDKPGVGIVSVRLDRLTRIKVHRAKPAFNGLPAN